MDDICRLCCSSNFVNNNIFDEENALYLKMSLYLPIKVLKNDRLPQKICDKCSCKVNDFYQFCNETIEVQNRLRSLLPVNVTDDIVDLTRIKYNASPLPGPVLQTQKYWLTQGTQTDDTPSCNNADISVKEEPRTLSPVKEEDPSYEQYFDGVSDNSDDVSLITLKKKKKSKKTNGTEKKRKKKGKLKDLLLMNGIEGSLEEVKQEPPELDVQLDVQNLKREPLDPDPIHCCICMLQCYSKTEIIQHYKQHALEAGAGPAPTAPAPPDTDPARCTRCKKLVTVAEWSSHWARHWERDTRPYRCSLCEKAFRDPHQIYKHGLSHQQGADECDKPRDKRFVCDLCPEGFVYMRYLMAHRLRAHPEAASRALALRCGVCARAFAHLNSLRRHLRAHSGRRDHLCNVCGKALSSREHLKFHIRIHTGHKPNICGVCGKGFVKKCNLTLHERVHSGEKPHVCAHCGKAFSQRSTLVIHERYHSGARPYVCALCGRGFVAKGLLSVHLKSTCI